MRYYHQPFRIFILSLSLLLIGACKSRPVTPPTVYLIGDSTAAQKQVNKKPETGWGEMLGEYLDPGIRIENHAKNGRSTKSFRDEGLWEAVRSQIQPGDYVFIQFGHNDPKPDSTRYSSPAQYGDNISRYVRETRAQGGKAVILSPIVRRKFDESGVLEYTHGEYPATAERIAAEMKVPFIDMTQLSRELVSARGDEPSKEFYLWLEAGENDNYPDGVSDDTHFSPAGARVMAGLVARGIQEQQIPLRRYLVSTVPKN